MVQSAKKNISKVGLWISKISFPGFEGYSLYEIFKEIFLGLRQIRLTERAAAISFNILMAIPPSLIFFATLVPFLRVENFEATILNAISLVATNKVMYDSIATVISDFLNTKQSELLSFGILFTIFYSSNGINGYMRSFDRDSDITKFRSGFNRRMKAVRLTVVLMFLSLILIALSITQSKLLVYILDYVPKSFNLIKIASTLSFIGIVYIMICTLYKYGTYLQGKFKFFSPGAAISTFLFIAVSYTFFYIATHIIQYNKIYGSLGTLLMFLAWLFISNLIVLIGFEINISILLRITEEKKRNDVEEMIIY